VKKIQNHCTLVGKGINTDKEERLKKDGGGSGTYNEIAGTARQAVVHLRGRYLQSEVRYGQGGLKDMEVKSTGTKG
jgi:hypothetical protein